jgi:hypothetical protein
MQDNGNGRRSPADSDQKSIPFQDSLLSGAKTGDERC